MRPLFDLGVETISVPGTSGISLDLSGLESQATDYVVSKTGGIGKAVASGAGIGAVLLPGLGALIGGTLGAILSGIKGKTPHIPDDQVWRTAKAVEASLAKSGIYEYQTDPGFRESFRNSAIAFITANNPGQSGRRPYFIGQVNAIADQGGIALADVFAYSIFGVSTDPNDPTGIAWRIENAMQKVVLPTVQEYEKTKGITSGTGLQFDPKQAGLWGIGLVILLGMAGGLFKGKKS